VVTTPPTHRVNDLNIDSADLGIGRSLGTTSYKLVPTFKSGTLIRVGEDGTVFLRGILQRGDGSAVSLGMGEVVATGKSAGKPRVVMTNRAGRFAVDGLRGGRYEIRIAGVEGAVAVEIPARFEGVCTLDALRITADSTARCHK
jgi:outer membrane usher protein